MSIVEKWLLTRGSDHWADEGAFPHGRRAYASMTNYVQYVLFICTYIHTVHCGKGHGIEGLPWPTMFPAQKWGIDKKRLLGRPSCACFSGCEATIGLSACVGTLVRLMGIVNQSIHASAFILTCAR